MFAVIRPYRFFLAAVMLFLTELTMLTIWRNSFGHHLSAAIFFTASLLTGLVGLWLSFQKRAKLLFQVPVNNKRNGTWPSAKDMAFFIAVVAISLAAYQQLNHLFRLNPVSVSDSDIIPQTQVFVQRVLQNQFPYQPISFGSYDLFPTYQPLQWLPFTLSELTGTDYRQLALLVLLLALGLFAIWMARRRLPAAPLLLITALAFLPLFAVIVYEPAVFTRTLEPLIAAYYLLLCLALFSRSAIVVGAALVACLLSRYAVILWVPLFFFLLMIGGERKKAAIVVAVCCLGVLMIYVVPFLRQDGSIFLKGYQYHSTAALAEWKGQAWQQPGEKPFQLFRGIGFASAKTGSEQRFRCK